MYMMLLEAYLAMLPREHFLELAKKVGYQGKENNKDTVKEAEEHAKLYERIEKEAYIAHINQ